MAGLADQVHACTSFSVFLMCALYIVFNEREVTIAMTQSYILFIFFKNKCHLLLSNNKKKTCSSFPDGFFVIIETMNRSMPLYSMST